MNISSDTAFNRQECIEPEYSTDDLLGLFNPNNTGIYDMIEIISRIVDGSNFSEYKKTYGKTLICGNGRIGGINVGIIASQKKISKSRD